MKFGRSIFITILQYIFFTLSLAPSCFMDGDFGESDISESATSSTSSLSWPLAEAEAIQIVGPRDFQALSGDLVVWTRLSPLVFNLTGTLDETLSLPSLWVQLLLVDPKDAKETLLTTQSIPSPITTAWEKVNFECNLIVKGGLYNVRVVHGDVQLVKDEEDATLNSIKFEYSRNLKILSNISIIIEYPTIVFDVPHRIEAYTTSTPISFGFTRSIACKPKLPLPSTLLVLSICTRSGAEIKTDSNGNDDHRDLEDSDNNMVSGKDCNRDFATVFRDPLHSLQKEGRITTSIECHLWARNATYKVQLREKSTNAVIAKSRPIRVEWGSQFWINMTKPTVMPCRGSIRAIVSYPSCILPGKDKIRIYGHETLSVPSLLVPNRLSYIGEQQIRPNNRVVTFRCNLFPQRFLRFCFQYINTAVDDSVAVVMEKCIPTNPPLKTAAWSSWSSWSPCTVTCGSDGSQFRYRFCDNPPPSSGANFCSGEAVEERSCDNTIPECPQHSSVFYIDSSGENLSPPQEVSTVINSHNTHQQHRHNTLQLENITITPGCECGCILYDLVPGKNETLVIFISSNHSSPCADEDEVDHHKFKWIFHTKDERDRVRLEVVDMEVQCVTITFRDGNTTDSNLLRVITSEEQTHYDDFLSQTAFWEGDEEFYEPLTLQSTGASLSIATASEYNKNCTGQFIYFIAYYSTLTSLNSSLGLHESGGKPVVSWISYEFWTLLVLKFILLFFFVVVILSGFGGCMTRAYRKGKYKELKCFDNEDEGANSDRASISIPGGEDDTSRCTSVTIMSFDYTYWRRLRLLRLKYFLLRPRPLNYVSAKVKSFPTTPTHQRVLTKQRNPTLLYSGQTEQPSCSSKGNRSTGVRAGAILSQNKAGNKYTYRLSKSISLSETNLRIKVEASDENETGEQRADEWPLQRKTQDEGGADGAKSHVTKAIYCLDPLSSRSRTPQSIGSTSVSNSLTESEAPSISTYSNSCSYGEKWTRHNEKLQKETENLKRRASADKKKYKDKNMGEEELDKCPEQDRRTKRSKKKVPCNLTNKGEMEKIRMGELTGLLKKRDIEKSQISVVTNQSFRLSSNCGEDETRGASRAEMEDADHDFEMDYYDYDVMNVSTIPGSYLGLEPAFVLWNSEVYQQEGEEEDENLQPIPTSSSNVSNNTSSLGECDIEMTTTTAGSSSSSLGIFSDSHFTKRQIARVRETSLDTLKFADDESDVDDNSTQASDSIFDNEHDLINENGSQSNLTSCRS